MNAYNKVEIFLASPAGVLVTSGDCKFPGSFVPRGDDPATSAARCLSRYGISSGALTLVCKSAAGYGSVYLFIGRLVSAPARFCCMPRGAVMKACTAACDPGMYANRIGQMAALVLLEHAEALLAA